MNFSMISYVIGRVLLCEGALLLLPTAVAIGYGERSSVTAFGLTIGICILLGMFLSFRKPKRETIYPREGFVSTALSWIVISIVGSLPFILTGAIPHPVDAIFETVSGFTTTGASILSDVESLPRSILLWRSFTHWIGGMGVLVFLLMILPFKGGSPTNLMKAESPGPQVEKLVPKLRLTAGILYGIYVFMTVLEIIFLLIGKMPLFDAVATAFGTAGTGGFGIKNDSFASYSSYIQIVTGIFMILFGVNFSFYFLILQKKAKRAFRIEEVRWYFIIIIVAVLIIAWNTLQVFGNFGTSLKQAFFQVGSIITTTGFSSCDFNLWPEVSKIILVILMFVGACAGSTGGGIKVSRIIILFKTVIKEVKNMLHPKRVGKISLDGKPIAHETVRSVNVYLVTYIMLFIGSLFIISFDNFDFLTNFTAVSATFNNIGPGLGMVGPTGNFGGYSILSKIVLTFDMLAGRLEIFPLLLLFYRQTWRKF